MTGSPDPEVTKPTAQPSWSRLRTTRIVALVFSSIFSLAAGYFAFSVPSSYYLAATYDPSATWQARLSSVMLIPAAVLLIVGFVGTVRINSIREDEAGYSSWGALLSTVPPVFLLALAVVARFTIG